MSAHRPRRTPVEFGFCSQARRKPVRPAEQANGPPFSDPHPGGRSARCCRGWPIPTSASSMTPPPSESRSRSLTETGARSWRRRAAGRGRSIGCTPPRFAAGRRQSVLVLFRQHGLAGFGRGRRNGLARPARSRSVGGVLAGGPLRAVRSGDRECLHAFQARAATARLDPAGPAPCPVGGAFPGHAAGSGRRSRRPGGGGGLQHEGNRRAVASDQPDLAGPRRGAARDSGSMSTPGVTFETRRS